ncbi:MAG: hypothetical protein ACLTV6_06435 [Christensenellales bacterium]
MNLYETIGKSNPTYLLADPEGADAIGIPCEPGNGTAARGTVMTRRKRHVCPGGERGRDGNGDSACSTRR